MTAVKVDRDWSAVLTTHEDAVEVIAESVLLLNQANVLAEWITENAEVQPDEVPHILDLISQLNTYCDLMYNMPYRWSPSLTLTLAAVCEMDPRVEDDAFKLLEARYGLESSDE